MSRPSCVSSQSPLPKKGKEEGREGGREGERIRQFGNTHSGMFLKEGEKGAGSKRGRGKVAGRGKENENEKQKQEEGEQTMARNNQRKREEAC